MLELSVQIDSKKLRATFLAFQGKSTKSRSSQTICHVYKVEVMIRMELLGFQHSRNRTLLLAIFISISRVDASCASTLLILVHRCFHFAFTLFSSSFIPSNWNVHPRIFFSTSLRGIYIFLTSSTKRSLRIHFCILDKTTEYLSRLMHVLTYQLLSHL